MYKATTIGISLRATLDEMVSEGYFGEEKVEEFMNRFQEITVKELASNAKIECHARGQGTVHRYYDNVWNLNCKEGATFHTNTETISTDVVQFVCVNADIISPTGKKNKSKVYDSKKFERQRKK
jgi:hypothetical protein